MKTLFRIDIGEQRRKLVLRVGREMGTSKYRGYALFDDDDYVDYHNQKWRKRALYFNVRRDGIEEMSPEHILKLLTARGCEHFVWISKRIGESEPIRMAWVYAHELRHAMQGALYPGLSEMTRSLREVLRHGYQVDFPQELDAEMAARDIVRQVFGEGDYQAYRRNQVESCPSADDYFRRFDELAAKWSGDPISETITIGSGYGLDLRPREKEQHPTNTKPLVGTGATNPRRRRQGGPYNEINQTNIPRDLGTTSALWSESGAFPDRSGDRQESVRYNCSPGDGRQQRPASFAWQRLLCAQR